jgi:hypothetical protein
MGAITVGGKGSKDTRISDRPRFRKNFDEINFPTQRRKAEELAWLLELEKSEQAKKR